MAQLGLDKTAEEFRVLHQERQMAIAKWQEATDLIAKRDEELQEIYNQVFIWSIKTRTKLAFLHFYKTNN